jgi:hypothetical protein
MPSSTLRNRFRLQEKPPTKTKNSSDIEFLYFFLFWGQFFPAWIWIRIPNADLDPLTHFNPDPKHFGHHTQSSP